MNSCPLLLLEVVDFETGSGNLGISAISFLLMAIPLGSFLLFFHMSLLII